MVRSARSAGATFGTRVEAYPPNQHRRSPKRYAHPVGVNRDDSAWRAVAFGRFEEGVVEAEITAAQGTIGARLRIASADEIVDLAGRFGEVGHERARRDR